MTRLLQLNNPTGIIKSKIKWLGEIPGADKKFAAYAHPYYGLRAGILNVYGKIKNKGLYTLNKLIPVLTPKADNNNTALYISELEKMTGLDRDQDLRNGLGADRMAALVTAITVMENGWDSVGPNTYFTLDNITGVAKDAINNTRLLEPKPLTINKTYWLGWACLAVVALGLITAIYFSNQSGGTSA